MNLSFATDGSALLNETDHRMKLTIATRESRLALWQAEHVKALLEQQGHAVTLLGMTTQGDQILDRSLSKVGGKGLFVKELEVALEQGRADLAVHSLKDVPMELPAGFVLACVMEREDPRDALVSPKYTSLSALPPGAVVGTSSLRRASQVAARFPALEIRPLRGNVNTRLAKLDRGDYDAIILAGIGLVRLGMRERVRSWLTVEESLPAGGQAALGIECRADRDDVIALIAPLADAAATTCVRAERAVNRALGGNCTIPLGAYAELRGERLRLRALVGAPDGRRIARADGDGDAADPEALGAQVAAQLRDRGAQEILDALGGR